MLIFDLPTTLTPSGNCYFIIQTPDGTRKVEYPVAFPSGGLAFTSGSNFWSGIQAPAIHTVNVSGNSFLPQLNISNLSDYYFTGGLITVIDPTGVINGASYTWRMYNSGTLVWDNKYSFGSGGPPVTNQTGKMTIIEWIGGTGNRMFIKSYSYGHLI